MLSWTEIMIIAVLLILLFGRGKISDLMGDVAKGIKSFKKGLADDDDAEKPQVADGGKTIDHNAAEKVNTTDTASTHNEQKAG